MTEYDFKLLQEKVAFCMDVSKKFKIPDDKNCIWSSGSHENPTISVCDLRAIQAALRIADRLQSGEVSESIRFAAHKAQYEFVNKRENARVPEYILLRMVNEKVEDIGQKNVDSAGFKAICTQLIKEVCDVV